MNEDALGQRSIAMRIEALLADVLGETRGAGPVGVGVDIEQTSRWNNPSPALLRSFTTVELNHARLDGAAMHGARLAGTWCAKEAVVKALGGIGVVLGVREAHITWRPSGAPTVELPTGRADAVATAVSVSYGAGLALACAIAIPLPALAGDTA